jgi:hypothetical protein
MLTNVKLDSQQNTFKFEIRQRRIQEGLDRLHFWATLSLRFKTLKGVPSLWITPMEEVVLVVVNILL